MISISKSTSIKFLVGLLVASGIMTYGFKSQIVKAASTTPTGQCGAIMNITPQNISPVAANQSYGSSALMYVDFTALKITARATVASFPSNYTTPSTTSGFPTYVTNTVTTAFTLTAGPVPNTYVLTPASGIPVFSVISVNGGSTFLLQAENDRGSGVCQMI
jgi:hypothetical protein